MNDNTFFSNLMDEIKREEHVEAFSVPDIRGEDGDGSQFDERDDTAADAEPIEAKPAFVAESSVFANSQAIGPRVLERCADVYAACPQLDWPVVAEPLMLADGTETPLKANVRIRPDSSREFLGAVKGRYRILQGSDLKAIPHPYIEAGLLEPTAAGVWRGKAWIQCDIVGCETAALKGHVTLGTSFDGSMATKWGQSITRIVCGNTMAHAMTDCTTKRKHSLNGNRLAMREMQDFVANLSESFQAVAAKLAAAEKVACDEQAFRAYINATFAENEEECGERVYQRVYEAWENPRGESQQYTMAGAYNAVTQYLTHERGRTPEARFDSVNFGLGREIGERALSLL